MATAATKPARVWRPRIPDAKDSAVLEALHAARVLTVPQLQRLYSLESVGSLHPRLWGLLGPEGTPRILERARGPDGRFYYALGPFGYHYLPPSDPPPVRHKPLARVRLAPQWTDHTLAVAWLMITWLTGGGDWQPEGSHLAWWGEHRAILPYPLPRRRGNQTHGRIEPDGAFLLVQPDGRAWVGALEHDAGSEDSADWASKLARWAAVIRCGSWGDRFGETTPHLLITVPTAARRAQIAPWVAAGRKEHGRFLAWIAVHGAVSVGEGDAPDAAPARVIAPAWYQVTRDPDLPLQPAPFTLPDLIEAVAPWRPDAPQPAPPAPLAASPATPPLAVAVRTQLDTQIRELRAQLTTQATALAEREVERDSCRDRWSTLRYDLTVLEQRYAGVSRAYATLHAAQPQVRLARYWTARHPLLLVGKGLVFWAALLVAGAGLPLVWLLVARSWELALAWDTGLGVFLDSGPTGGALLLRLWLTPWCGGPLVLGSVVGTVAAWRWARRQLDVS